MGILETLLKQWYTKVWFTAWETPWSYGPYDYQVYIQIARSKSNGCKANLSSQIQ